MTYDVKLKMDAVPRYGSGGISIRGLAREMGVNGNTLWGWIRKSRNAQSDPMAGGQTAMIDMTSVIKGPSDTAFGAVTLRVNGVDISTDASGVRAIIDPLLSNSPSFWVIVL